MFVHIKTNFVQSGYFILLLPFWTEETTKDSTFLKLVFPIFIYCKRVLKKIMKSIFSLQKALFFLEIFIFLYYPLPHFFPLSVITALIGEAGLK